MTPNPDARQSVPGFSPIHQHLEILDRAESVVYKRIEEGPDLKAHVFFPEGHQKTNNSPGILFFHGSGWDLGSITQFAPHALYFAERGAVTVLVEYRTASTHGTAPLSSMQDGRSAVRWLRFYADQLGIDPAKVVSAGASAGAHIAASSAMSTDPLDDDTDPPLSAAPDAVMLFSPIIDVLRKGYTADRFPDSDSRKMANLSRFIRKELPPMIVFHGTRDRLNPFENVRKFCKRMTRKKNVCELVHFEGRENSFFNLNVDPISYEHCINTADRFLVDQGFLKEDAEASEDAFRLQSWR